ncbi:TonB-dependent receptor [uncultured Maribacter sp.]|uniref:TonB-dependent receptor n=1 Tax=uncultured Maribacter sp. TaxID=431308 RepID=UPI002616607B|nr:TonB-dependent receptor [uncultured Maribacter sp.]
MNRPFSLIILFVIGLSFSLNAQNIITGKITDIDDVPLPGATVVAKGTTSATITDEQGKYQLNLVEGSYTIVASYLGFKSITKKIQVTSGTNNFTFKLEEDFMALDAVVVSGKSDAQILREQAYAVEVVETEGFKNLSTNGNDILAKIPGVNIRQSGGVGSDFSLSLNGLSGNQVRVFIDGIPMDYFGSSLSLNNFSANLLQSIEVYKGVVPIHLSSDALGGAINIVTDQNSDSFLDFSYGLGSYQTHIASLNTQYRNKKSGFAVRLKSFYNTSQNNYKVPIKLVNFETGKEDEEATNVEHFHDAYNSKMAWLETGFLKSSFADKLMVGVMYSDNYDEVQQPANAIGEAKIPYGEVTSEEQKVIGTFSFKKNRIFNTKLNLNAYMVGVFSESNNIDISDYTYDWFGNRELRDDTSVGEIENRKTYLRLHTDNYLGNLNGEYEINENNNIAANYSLNALTIQGNDDFKEENNTQFSDPSDVTKQVMAFSYTNAAFDNKLKNTIFTKFYNYDISSLITNYSGTETEPLNIERKNTGFGISSTYLWNGFQIKASFENAIRFPEVSELFGDGLNIEPSPSLLPEKSNNYNVGVSFNNNFGNSSLRLSANGYIRDAEDFILPVVEGIKVYHINNCKVLAKGVDFSANYVAAKKFFFALSATYLDLRDNNEWLNGVEGNSNSQYKVRVPNVPYFFSNGSISYRQPNLFKNEDSFTFSISENYVHEFFYTWENLGSSEKPSIPQQWVTNAEVVYSMNDQKYNVSVGVANLLNADVYDNYQQLRPGRTFNLKLRYFIN